MPRNVNNKEAGKLASFVQEEVEMGIRQWWKKVKNEKKRKKLIQAAQKLENKADPTISKKTLPKNRAVKQEIIGVEKSWDWRNSIINRGKIGKITAYSNR